MRAFGPVVIWMALIFLVSSMPNPPGPTGGETRSYAAHFVEYSILAFLTARALGRWRPGLPLLYVVLLAAVAATAYGLSDELHQAFVPRRDADIVDAGFDALGALLGATAWAKVELWLRRPRSRPA